jgi:hypothetical protein
MQFKYTVLCCLAGLVTLSMYCANPIGGTDTGNPKVSGVLFNKDGSRATHVLVRFIPANYNPRSGMPASFDSAITNDTGMYSFDSLPTNFYNVLGSGSGVVSFQDSVVIVSTARTIVPSDTLKDPGSLEGVVQLQPGDDCSTVFLIVMGTTLWSVPTDSFGNFSISNLAEGEYRLRVISTLDQYQPLDIFFTIQAGKTATLLDTIRLRYTGIPIPTGVRLVYDSLMHQVTLTWDKADPTLVKGYCVYRSDVDENTTFEQINRLLITDTVFVDSTMEDSTTYAYKICAVDIGDNKGKLSIGVRIRVGIRLLPKITGHPQSDTFNLGSSISLQISAIGPEPLSYAWYKRTGDSIYKIPDKTKDTCWIDSAMVTDSGNYFCEVSNPYGSARSNNAHIAINCLPRIVEDPQSDTVDLGSPVLMMVVAGGPELSYVWYKKESDSISLIANQIGNIFVIDHMQLSDTGTYFCVVSNSFGSDTSNSAHIMAGDTNVSPWIAIQPIDTMVSTGWSGSFRISVKGMPPFMYTWYKNGIEYQSGIDDTVLWFSSVTVSDSGYYRCIVRNEYGADTSRTAHLAVIEGRPVIMQQPADTTVMENTPFSLSVAVTGPAPFTFQWFKGYARVGSANPFSVASARLADSGDYRCFIRNSFGVCTTSTARVTVVPRPENSLTLSASKIDALQVTLRWTNSAGTPYDSFRIWYATMPIPDTNPSPSVFSSQGIAGTATTMVIRNLKELTTYYFGIQGARAGIWSDIPAAAMTSATTQKDTALAIPNTMKILDVVYDTATFKIKVTYRIDPLGFQHRVGFSWLQRSQGVPPLPTEFAEPILSPRLGEIAYTDSLGETTTYEFDMANASPALNYATEYYFGGWVSKVAEKWALPTDSSIFYYAIPQPKAVPAVLFKNTDTVTAFNGQIPNAQDSGRKP